MEFISVVVKKTEMSDETFKIILDTIASWFPCIITLEKMDENPHCHIIVQTDKPINSVRDKIRKLAPSFLSGRSRTLQVVKVKDYENYLVYILKEKNIYKNNLVCGDQLTKALKDTDRINLEKQKRNERKNKNVSWSTLLVENYVPDRNLITRRDIQEHIISYCAHSKINGNFCPMLLKRVAWRIYNNYYLEEYFTDMFAMLSNTFNEN